VQQNRRRSRAGCPQAARRTLDVVIEFVRAGRVPYLDAWDQQRGLHARRVADGKRTEAWERPIASGTPVIDVDRGGRITWHGPGQLTGYPIVRLADPVDVVAYVRRLEDVLMSVCASYDVPTARVEGRSGVWTEDGRRKVAAIGIRVARGVTMHGFALNCDCDLAVYDAIVPCGITDAGVTSLTQEAGRPITVADVLSPVEAALRQVLDHDTMATV
jgi:lipoyl(octanoyl) transferase